MAVCSGFNVDKADLLHLAQTALFGLIGVLTLLVVLRPMVLRITSVTPSAFAGGNATAGALAAPAGAALCRRRPRRHYRGGAPLPLLEDESMVNLAQIEGQMRASSLRRIGELVENIRTRRWQSCAVGWCRRAI